MLDFLSKTAGILNEIDSPAAKQAAAALESVLMAHAARRTTVMTHEEVVEFNTKLKQFLDDTLGSGKIPRGLKWRLLQLQDGQTQLTKQLANMEKRRGKGPQPLMPAEPPGKHTSVEMPGEIMLQDEVAPTEAPVEAEQSWADIAEEGLREMQQRAPTVAPAAVPELARKPLEVMEKSPPVATESPMVTEDAQKDVPAPASFKMHKQPAVKVLSPEQIKDLATNPPSAPSKYAPKGTKAEPPKASGTHAETWDDKLKRWVGLSNRAELLTDMVKIADKLDAAGYVEAANIVEKIIVEAAEQYPSPSEARKDLYDFSAHNKETMHGAVKSEVEENRKNHHLHTHQGTAVSQTRYSPDMPGVMMQRVSDGVYRDTVTGKVYDFHHGFTDASGTSRSGGSIKHQTPSFSQYAPPSRVFEGAGTLSRRK
jgi:hypothetical protein